MTSPTQLNQYRILGPLGQGGMGAVYLAEDTRLNRKVAVKVLSALMASDTERRQRFEREAQAIAALNHPNIVTIHSVEEDNGAPFIVMELVEGRSLAEVIAAGGLPLDALLRVGIAVSEAIAVAHQRGITHRDLKPGNVMVTADGRVKVLDFGLAKLREAELDAEGVTRLPSGDLTGEGRILGTVAYMSPEQAEGKTVDPRSDIFSLGVMLHEMATGERPFKGDTNVSVLSSILKDNPSSITDLNPRLPPGLGKIIRRALAKDPSRRYQTATDLRNDLEDLKQEIETAATVSMSAPRRQIATSRAKLPAAIAGAVVLVALVAAAVYLSTNGPAEATAFDADRFVRLTTAGNASIAAMSPDGRYVVHVKHQAGQRSLWIRQTATSSDVQIVAPAPVRYDGVTYSSDSNYVYYVTYELSGGVGTLYKVPTLGGTSQRLIEDIDSRVSFSPDGARITFVRGDPSVGRSYIMIAEADGTGERKLASLEPPEQFQVTAPAWSPDGRTILASSQSLRDGPHALVYAVDVNSGTPRPIAGRWAFVNDLDWMPDSGSFIVSAADFSTATGQLWQVMYPSGEQRRVTNDLNTYIGVSVAADGRTLATVQTENISHIWIRPVAAESAERQITSGRRGDGLAGIAWTPDGRVVFSSNGSGLPEIWIANADGSNALQLTSTGTPSSGPSVTPDNRYIVHQRFREKGVYVWRMGLDGSNPTPLTQGGAEMLPIAAADGKWVYFTSLATGQPRPFRVSIDGGEPQSLGPYHYRATSASPDGQTLIGVAWDTERRRSSAAILPAAGGSLRMLPEVTVQGLLWAPDGAVSYGDGRDGRSNLWKRRLDESKPQLVGSVQSENVFSYAWSADGRQLAIAKGQAQSDVVMISRK